MLTWRGGVGGQLPRNVSWSLVFRSVHAVVTAVAFHFQIFLLSIMATLLSIVYFKSQTVLHDKHPPKAQSPSLQGQGPSASGEFVLTGKWCSKELRFTNMDVVLKFYQFFFSKIINIFWASTGWQRWLIIFVKNQPAVLPFPQMKLRMEISILE